MPSRKKTKRVLNLPSFKLPIKPLTPSQLDADIRSRIFRIDRELVRGFDFIKSNARSVTFFGSARMKKSDPYYKKATRLAQLLSQSGFAVVTGGGPGVMEAANLGAFLQGGKSLGLSIKLPNEQVTNPYVTDYTEFYYFFTRKVCLTYSAEAFIYFPGGFGTFDEFFEILTLVQTKKVIRVPIILVGKEYWEPFVHHIKTVMCDRYKMISRSDLKLFRVMDDEEKIVDILKRVPTRYN